jgi:Icc-related predicted phosphoesterase
LHGSIERFEKLFLAIATERPNAVFFGGDILPSASLMFSSQGIDHADFISGFLVKRLVQLRNELKNEFPKIFIILGNDDGRSAEASIKDTVAKELWVYVHNRKVLFKNYPVFGYSYIPPTPFLLKDWEKYDVSRHVDPGSVSPEEGMRTYSVSDHSLKYSTIKKDLDELTRNEELDNAIFLFHAPPYKTKLDRAALDGKVIDHIPLDVHVGSIAIQRFIKTHQPLLTLHGHVHESSRLTHNWRDNIGKTHMFTAAHDGPELALVRFNPKNLKKATRQFL